MKIVLVPLEGKKSIAFELEYDFSQICWHFHWDKSGRVWFCPNEGLTRYANTKIIVDFISVVTLTDRENSNRWKHRHPNSVKSDWINISVLK